MASSRRAVSETVRVIGPTWSSVQDKGMTPRVLTRPYVGLCPTIPQYAAGILIEPAVSAPNTPLRRPPATGAADQPEEPPAIQSKTQGFRPPPNQVTRQPPPNANSQP